MRLLLTQFENYKFIVSYVNNKSSNAILIKDIVTFSDIYERREIKFMPIERVNPMKFNTALHLSYTYVNYTSKLIRNFCLFNFQQNGSKFLKLFSSLIINRKYD